MKKIIILLCVFATLSCGLTAADYPNGLIAPTDQTISDEFVGPVADGFGVNSVTPTEFTWGFQTVGTTDDGNTVQAFGELSYLGNEVSGWVTNSSETPATLLGIWFQSDTVGSVTDLFVSEPWDFQTILPTYMKNLVGSGDLDRYFGFELDQSVHGWEPASTQGETFSFSFTADNLFVNEENGLHDVLFRWQQVGENFEDSAKTFGSLFENDIPPVPEPRTIGIIASIGVLAILGIRRRIKK